MVLNRVLMSVDLPRPDSPNESRICYTSAKMDSRSFHGYHEPTTIAVNWNPFLTDFLWTWLGKLANPTYPMSFLRTAEEKP